MIAPHSQGKTAGSMRKARAHGRRAKRFQAVPDKFVTSESEPARSFPRTSEDLRAAGEEGGSIAMKHIRQHAIVIGASMGGLLAARALSDFYAVVTVLERDTFPQSDIPRKGVPQGRHAHGLLARGRIALGGQSSLKLFDQRLPTLHILAHPQHDTERCQVVRQLAIGTGIHIIDE